MHEEVLRERGQPIPDDNVELVEVAALGISMIVVWFFTIAGVLGNAVLHPLLALRVGGYFPGAVYLICILDPGTNSVHATLGSEEVEFLSGLNAEGVRQLEPSVGAGATTLGKQIV